MPSTYTSLDTEATIRHFYQQFLPHYTNFCASIEGIDNLHERSQYAKLVINRLLFLWLLQQHSWLAGDTNYLVHALAQNNDKKSFYHYILLPLCQQLCLAKHEKTSIALSRCDNSERLPQCKLSLFAPHPLERTPSAIYIPDSAFMSIFNFLKSYRWSLEPVDNQREIITPAVLSYVLEQQSDQKHKGIYYTRDDVTCYITENTILPYLLHAFQQHFPCLTLIRQLLRTAPDRYIHPHVRSPERLPMETEREYQRRRQQYQQLLTFAQSEALQSGDDLITYRFNLSPLLQDLINQLEQPAHLMACYNLLSTITILDPTCGSGAFLLAALARLEPLYAACLERIITSTTQAWQHTPLLLAQKQALLSQMEQYVNQRHFILTTILQHNLYGVDIMHEAIDICKQHLLLTLLATLPPDTQMIPALDLDAHLHTGNALVGTCYDYPISRETQSLNRQGFCWSQAFGGVLARGGFDVITGNPPYIEYSKLRKSGEAHTLGNVANCGNLYAAIIERALSLCRPEQSYLGLIVPLSICSSERFIALRQNLTRQSARLWLANFEIFPCRLFANAYQRLTILLAHHQASADTKLFVTHLQRWYTAERPYLFSTMRYTQVCEHIRPTTFPRLAAPCQENILRKLVTRAEGNSIARLLSPTPTPHFVSYQEATNYWMKAACRIPFYRKNGLIMPPPHSRTIFFADACTARNIMALMNSSLFYLWFATYADGFHLSHLLVKAFPVGPDIGAQKTLTELACRLEQDINQHSRRSTRNTRARQRQNGGRDHIELEEYYMVYSKPILDQIDMQLAHYYAFTDQELDFIVNYDAKYRMGQHSS
jgi:hypothetical protein